MQRISSLASRRELGGLAAACAAGIRAGRPFSAEPRLRSPRGRFAAESRRPLSSQPPPPPGSPGPRPAISVVGIPDPLTWLRCKAITTLIDLYFQIDINSEDFESGVKQVTRDVTKLNPQ